MASIDRTFARLRQQALRRPVTRANTRPDPVELGGGVTVALSVNK
jgi:hypothetical protein